MAPARRLRRRGRQSVPRLRDARRAARRGARCRTSTFKQAVAHYIRACTKGVLKVMSKMGISTLQSYRGAQIFEAVGLDKAFVDRCFTWTASRVGGIGIDTVAEEVIRRHERAFADRGAATTASSISGGRIPVAPRRRSTTCSTRETVFKLQHASRSGAARHLPGIRPSGQRPEPAGARPCAALLGLKAAPEPIPIEGSRAGRGDLQALLHRGDVLRVHQRGGARDAGHRDETGSAAGRIPAKGARTRPGTPPDENGDLRRSAVKQVSSGRFGVTSVVPRQRGRPADQDGPGGQAGGRRPASRLQGLPVDREGALLDAGRRPHLAAAAPRHLLHRGPGPSSSTI